jgi:hypothetical protein
MNKMREALKQPEERRRESLAMGGPEKIERQHRRGKLTARERAAPVYLLEGGGARAGGSAGSQRASRSSPAGRESEMEEYFKKPEPTEEAFRNGWFHTGDGACRSEEGDYYFVDRMGGFIRTRGENVSSWQVEKNKLRERILNERAGKDQGAGMKMPGLARRFADFLLTAAFFSVLFASGPVHAIEVAPLEHDFGEIEVGESNSTVITISNYTGHPHTITTVAFSKGSSPDFSLATSLDLPMTLASLDRLELEIVFSPSGPGLALADLRIHSIDSSLSIVTVSLRGGTGAPPPSGACAASER